MSINYEGSIEPWSQLIILEKFETLPNLMMYDVEDYLALFELVLINTTNKMLSMANISK